MDTYTTAEAPLGPIREHDIYARGGPYGDDSMWVGTYYTDLYVNEYNSVEHVALCTVRKALNQYDNSRERGEFGDGVTVRSIQS